MSLKCLEVYGGEREHEIRNLEIKISVLSIDLIFPLFHFFTFYKIQLMGGTEVGDSLWELMGECI